MSISPNIFENDHPQVIVLNAFILFASFSELFENQTIGFIFYFVMDLITCIFFLAVPFIYLMLCISVCLFIGTITDDMSFTTQSKLNIDKQELVQIVKLHLQCYRFLK